MSALGHPTYVDCEIGEAYKIENDEFISLNRYIDLGSKVPVLKGGSNIITFDSTVTSLKVAPRWWIL
jgi:phage-related protein